MEWAAGSTRATGAACGPPPADRRARGRACWIAAAAVGYRGPDRAAAGWGRPDTGAAAGHEGHGGCPRYLRRPTTAGVVPRAPQRSPTRCKTGTPPRFHRYCAGFCSRARVGSATAPRDDGSGIAGELAAPHLHARPRKLKLTLKTDACLRPGSVPRQAPGRPRSMGRGTCPENSRGVRKISDTSSGGRANRHWRSPTMAAAGQPLACGEPPSSVIAATRLRALVQHVRRSVRPQNTTSLPPS